MQMGRSRGKWNMLGMYAGLFFLLLCLMGATLYAYQLRCEYTSAHELSLIHI